MKTDIAAFILSTSLLLIHFSGMTGLPHATAIPVTTNAPAVSTGVEKTGQTEVRSALFSVRLRVFHDILDRKLAAADPDTRRSFAPLKKLVDNALNAPAQSSSPATPLEGDSTTKLLEAVAADPVSAAFYEEARRHAGRTKTAVIRPDRGHGAVYTAGESVHFLVTANEDCFFQVLYLSREDAAGKPGRLRVQLLYPDPADGSTFLPAGKTRILGENEEYTVQPPFENDLVVLVSAKKHFSAPVDPDGMFLSAPFEFSRLPEMLYGVNAPPSLSFDSCFFVSRPQEARARTKGQPFLNEEEASSLRLDDAEWNARPRVFRSLPAGPIIKVHEPLLREDENPTIETGTPLNLRITFEKNHAPVDMDSLEVTAKKGFFTLSITDRVRPYIHGTELAARTLDFPRGRFRIRLEIADVDGVVTSREYRLEVH